MIRFCIKTTLLSFFIINLSQAEGSCQFIISKNPANDDQNLINFYNIEGLEALKPYFKNILDSSFGVNPTVTVSENNKFVITTSWSLKGHDIFSYKIDHDCNPITGRIPILLPANDGKPHVIISSIQKNNRLYLLTHSSSGALLLSYRYNSDTGNIIDDKDFNKERRLPANCDQIVYNPHGISHQIYVTCGKIIYAYDADDIKQKSTAYVFNYVLGKIKIYNNTGTLFVINSEGKTVDAYLINELVANDPDPNKPKFSYRADKEAPLDFEFTYSPFKTEADVFFLFITTGNNLYYYKTTISKMPYPWGRLGKISLRAYQPLIASSWSADKDFDAIINSNSPFRLSLLQQTPGSMSMVSWQSIITADYGNLDWVKDDFITDMFNSQTMLISIAPTSTF